jgi:hypothetical protein
VIWVVAAVCLALLLCALLVPLRVELSAEARADPGGQWAIACGAGFGPLALSAVSARGVPASVHVFVFGKRRVSHDLGDGDDDATTDEAATDEHEPPRRRKRWARLRRSIDPIDAFAWVLGERRRVRWRLDVDVSYSFRDVALTGKLLGAGYVLAPLLPSGITLRQSPSWESADRAALQASGNVRIFAGLVLCDLIWYMLRRTLSPRRQRRGPTSQAWPKPKSSTS